MWEMEKTKETEGRNFSGTKLIKGLSVVNNKITRQREQATT
jgi:hypothetical protein